MTTVYFVRHAQSDASVQDPFLRPLTEQGLRDRRLVTEFLSGREVTALFSSPYKRAVDTLVDFSEKQGLPVQTVEDFREHETISDSYPDENYFPFIQKYWKDPAYKVPGDESLEELQQRNVRALERVLEAYPGKTVAIATHGMALSVLHGILCTLAATAVMPGFLARFTADGTIEAELQVITGATNEMGFNRLSAR